MKRALVSSISYLTAGVGCFYLFSGHISFASLIILALGIIGILYDVFYLQKSKTE